jgi:hypothetical protein
MQKVRWKRLPAMIAESQSYSVRPLVHNATLPGAPYRHSNRELRRHRTEERNDRTLIVLIVVLGGIGALRRQNRIKLDA